MSNRIIYVAIGEFSGSKEDALTRLKKWESDFRNDIDFSLNAIFPHRIAEKCNEVERKIIDFEKLVGERTRIEVCEGFSSPIRGIDKSDSIAIQNTGAKLYPAFSEVLAREISALLESILIELGATKTISGYID